MMKRCLTSADRKLSRRRRRSGIVARLNAEASPVELGRRGVMRQLGEFWRDQGRKARLSRPYLGTQSESCPEK
jgi:hypothetical protein